MDQQSMETLPAADNIRVVEWRLLECLLDYMAHGTEGIALLPPPQWSELNASDGN